jgi:hypothetical protein
MNHLFLISSAIKTKFGAFDEEARFNQTLQTIDSIQKRIPNASIVMIESSGIAIEDELLLKLKEIPNIAIINMSGHPYLKSVVDNNEHWDVVKNLCELIAFNSALKLLEEETNILEGVDRIHKLSGRYTLSDDFDLNIYEQFPNSIILLNTL